MTLIASKLDTPAHQGRVQGFIAGFTNIAECICLVSLGFLYAWLVQALPEQMASPSFLSLVHLGIGIIQALTLLLLFPLPGRIPQLDESPQSDHDGEYIEQK